MDARQIIPAELLVPPDAYSRGFDHDDAALVLDGWLRRLAAQDSRCRAVLGRLANAFLRRRGQHQLGFSRVDDYARERLGLSGRELQSLATVMRRLEGLPRLNAAFDHGRLSWAHVRLLTGVATAEDENRWLEVARGRTVRALEGCIREAGNVPDTDESDEPDVRFRLRCSRRARRLWHGVVELARRMAGSQLSQGQAAEAIAAEGLSARPATGESWPFVPGVSEAHDPNETTEAFAPDLDWREVNEAIPDDIESLGDDSADLDPFTLDARMRAVIASMHRVDWQTGRLLRVFLDRRLYRAMLFPSAARYVRERLGISDRRARALTALERKTWTAPALGDAWQSGRISWVRALAVMPVASEGTAPAWVARAGEVTIRRLTDEVEWALVTGETMPPPAGASLQLSERQLRARPEWELADTEIAFSAPASVVALIRTAILAFAWPADSLAGGFEKLLLHVKAEWEA